CGRGAVNDLFLETAGLVDVTALADGLGMGLLLESRPRPLNDIMAALVREFGTDAFLKPGDVTLQAADGRLQHVRITRVHLTAAVVLAVAPRKRRTPLPGRGLHPFLQLDRQGHVRWANHAAWELLDYAGTTGIEARLATAVPEAIARGQWHVDLALGPRLFNFVIADVDDDTLHAYGREVSERRFMEASLRASEARLRALIEAAPDAILITTTYGCIEYVNPQAEAMFGFDRGELLGRGIESLIPDWFASAHVLRLLAGEQAPASTAGEALLSGQRRDGTRFPLEVSSSPLRQDGAHYLASIVRDVTERERAARQIRSLNEHLARHVEQLTSLNRELEAFSYSVSHDLRGPLRSIDGFSAILADDYADRLDAEGQDYLQRIRAATGRMSELIDGLLRLSRITRADLVREDVDLSALAQTVAESLQLGDPGRAVEFAIEPGVRAHADRALLTVVLENLFGNAWKFTAGRSPARIGFACEQRDGRTVYVVRDNGAGFDMQYAGKLFRPFERLHGREYPGTGIGLATVQRIVQRHGGEVWAESREGEGASFYFTL
ncbi:MAG: PAS domain S-box protein, partial [Thiohalomonadaceae bacterium]